MSIRISRDLPPSGTPTRYEVFRSPTMNGTYDLVDSLVFTAPGPNYDGTAKKFFYVDDAGTSTSFYRVIAYDSDNVILDDSGPFAFSPNTAAVTPTLIKVDHNFGEQDAFQVVTQGGVPIADATIRVYKEADFVQGLTDLALAVTMTRDDGRWTAPVHLSPGFSYVLLFEKKDLYGPLPVVIAV